MDHAFLYIQLTLLKFTSEEFIFTIMFQHLHLDISNIFLAYRPNYKTQIRKFIKMFISEGKVKRLHQKNFDNRLRINGILETSSNF
jgi:hypothetical protein